MAILIPSKYIFNSDVDLIKNNRIDSISIDNNITNQKSESVYKIDLPQWAIAKVIDENGQETGEIDIVDVSNNHSTSINKIHGDSDDYLIDANGNGLKYSTELNAEYTYTAYITGTANHDFKGNFHIKNDYEFSLYSVDLDIPPNFILYNGGLNKYLFDLTNIKFTFNCNGQYRNYNKSISYTTTDKNNNISEEDKYFTNPAETINVYEDSEISYSDYIYKDIDNFWGRLEAYDLGAKGINKCGVFDDIGKFVREFFEQDVAKYSEEINTFGMTYVDYKLKIPNKSYYLSELNIDVNSGQNTNTFISIFNSTPYDLYGMSIKGEINGDLLLRNKFGYVFNEEKSKITLFIIALKKFTYNRYYVKSNGDKFTDPDISLTYYPTKFEMDFLGTKIEFDPTAENYGKISTKNPTLTISSINYFQSNNSVSSTLANNILTRYKTGKKNATIRVAIADYYDYTFDKSTNQYIKGAKKISIANDDLPMVFKINDRVIPQRYNVSKKDEGILTNYTGQAIEYYVVGTKFIYDGAVWQELELQEV